MNKPLNPQDVTAPKVTTGALSGSRKIYSLPDGHADLRVPLREIALNGEPAFRVYDTSGPYTDPDAAIDVKRGLPPLRKPWIEARGGGPRDAARIGAGRDRHQGDGLHRPSREYRTAMRGRRG